MVRVEKIKTKKGKRVLVNRASKTVENDKKALFCRGAKTNEIISHAMMDLFDMKKPLTTKMDKHNPYHLFEDETPIVRAGSKFDTSLFVLGSNSKKKPNCLTFGRTYDGQLLDMAELRITSYKSSSNFEAAKMTLGSKPCVILEGAAFESDGDMKRIGNLMVDWFRGPKVDTVRLEGLETVIVFTALDETNLALRVYRPMLKKSATATPRVELAEMGPSISFEVMRKKLADDALFKLACKKPKALMKKRRKNLSEDVFGNQLARVHVGKQRTDDIQTRKVKALRKTPLVEAAPENAIE
ncbi:Ribosome production factor 2 homolog [Caenorhabditis elegans]|uniref:Ribosome production factor 2 homolog n=1 Tax=Caenorhabditis elegans TaxID=6239 RepID=RPF2_CAEEL|nr:Ribosome production factor 2 homolog [Caenorhabditis elegans]Q9N3F0.1 RecName: Full=Ribosome production factor 2 homolog; AltName: Full=Brix domain-containing protein 1 homolog; AltName: Full=Ribosome biogenesis protein RPF2 homolog [Caenorhabditis elegans]CCD72829.1 Ribosome production factor 2 homolog [Caenorhabditis elegans]|eukprot:NP_491117.1 Ribosome production factor 2 homolog [Caenorhabditis elegans]